MRSTNDSSPLSALFSFVVLVIGIVAFWDVVSKHVAEEIDGGFAHFIVTLAMSGTLAGLCVAAVVVPIMIVVLIVAFLRD